jgi:hypothetical protein
MMDGDDLRGYPQFRTKRAVLGTAEQIIGRRVGCSFCSIVAKRLVERGLAGNSETESFVCSAVSVNFCGMDMETRPKRYTQRLAVLVRPSAPRMPLQPHIEDAMTLVEFQALIPRLSESYGAGLSSPLNDPRFGGRLIDKDTVDTALLDFCEFLLDHLVLPMFPMQLCQTTPRINRLLF